MIVLRCDKNKMMPYISADHICNKTGNEKMYEKLL